KRLELHTNRLSEAEALISQAAGPDQTILDVQRFGDRLDVLAHDPDNAERLLRDKTGAAGLQLEDLRVDEPTLENVFVATLRGLGLETHEEPFPGRLDHSALRGKIAIGASGLTRQFGSFTAVHQISLQVKYGEIYGLLGANGAGKTTTIKMLCGLLEP